MPATVQERRCQTSTCRLLSTLAFTPRFGLPLAGGGRSGGGVPLAVTACPGLSLLLLTAPESLPLLPTRGDSDPRGLSIRWEATRLGWFSFSRGLPIWGEPVRLLGSLMRGLALMAGTPEAMAEGVGWSMIEWGAPRLRRPTQAM